MHELARHQALPLFRQAAFRDVADRRGKAEQLAVRTEDLALRHHARKYGAVLALALALGGDDVVLAESQRLVDLMYPVRRHQQGAAPANDLVCPIAE